MYNAEKTIVRAINSILNQTTSRVREIIIINDGSEDNSKREINKYIDENKLNYLVKIIDKKNEGVSIARNIGMTLAIGEYIAFLDADDVWVNEKIEKQMKIMDENKHIGMIGSSRNDYKYKTIFLQRKGCFYHVPFKVLLFKNFFATPTVIIRKKIINKVGFFNPQKKYGEDLEYFIRIAKLYPSVLLNESLVICDEGKPTFGFSGLSSNLYGMEIEQLKTFKALYKEKIIKSYHLEYVLSESIINDEEYGLILRLERG